MCSRTLGIDHYPSSLFLFCGKRCDRLKALLWQPDGFVLLYKRLDNAGISGRGMHRRSGS
ncbi:IS66 family insertion sequence element accessory protein TnpB [Faecalibacterium sp. An121]|uniref:IS66 family insertion sequence element accessory protein TnpB n=1 Tax=Faecalibacterium sp. An121 TaxID=1965550 RepID=UPI00117A3286